MTCVGITLLWAPRCAGVDFCARMRIGGYEPDMTAPAGIQRVTWLMAGLALTACVLHLLIGSIITVVRTRRERRIVRAWLAPSAAGRQGDLCPPRPHARRRHLLPLLPRPTDRRTDVARHRGRAKGPPTPRELALLVAEVSTRLRSGAPASTAWSHALARIGVGSAGNTDEAYPRVLNTWAHEQRRWRVLPTRGQCSDATAARLSASSIIVACRFSHGLGAPLADVLDAIGDAIDDAQAVEEARRVAAAAREAGVFTKVAFNLRHFPATMRLKELADAGALGEITQFSARYLHSGSIDPDRPMGWKQGLEGGVLLDLGSHALDLLTWIAGYPQEAMCAFRTLYPSRPTREGGVETHLSEDHALMALRLPGGALGTVEASKIATGALDELTLEVRGTRGAAIFETMRPNYLRWFDQSRPERPLGGERGFVDIECAARYPAPGGKFLPGKNAIGWDRAHIDCYFDFLNCIHHGRRPESTVEEAARLQSLMDSLAASAKEGGRWVRA